MKIKKYERFMKIKNVKDSFQQSYINPWKSVDIVREKQTAGGSSDRV